MKLFSINLNLWHSQWITFASTQVNFLNYFDQLIIDHNWGWNYKMCHNRQRKLLTKLNVTCNHLKLKKNNLVMGRRQLELSSNITKLHILIMFADNLVILFVPLHMFLFVLFDIRRMLIRRCSIYRVPFFIIYYKTILFGGV